MTRSRGFFFMAASFVLIRFIRKLLNRNGRHFPKLKKKFVFTVLILVVVLVLIFSYVWVYVVSIGNLSDHRVSLNDGSNRKRFIANIYAWEEQLTKIDFNMLFCGFGGDLKLSMGIQNDENVQYLGLRLVQSHNSVLNLLVRMGWIPGIIYLWLLVSFVCKYFTENNYEYIIPFFVNSMFISVYHPNYLILWCLIIALPCVKKDRISKRKLLWGKRVITIER